MVSKDNRLPNLVFSQAVFRELEAISSDILASCTGQVVLVQTLPALYDQDQGGWKPPVVLQQFCRRGLQCKELNSGPGSSQSCAPVLRKIFLALAPNS